MRKMYDMTRSEYLIAYREKHRAETRLKWRKYYQDNKLKLAEEKAEYYKKNKSLVLQRTDAWRRKNQAKVNKNQAERRAANREQISEQRTRYRERTYARIREVARNYENGEMRSNPNYRLAKLLRNRIGSKLRECKAKKDFKTLEIIGCSISELKTHLEKQFDSEMSWENHGMFGWHIDHIKPCAVFDLTDPEQQAECFHYSNLQPLWAKDNWSKGAKCK
jgi:hypothetical protein